MEHNLLRELLDDDVEEIPRLLLHFDVLQDPVPGIERPVSPRNKRLVSDLCGVKHGLSRRMSPIQFGEPGNKLTAGGGFH
jgi:hypothetical protein